MFRLDGAHDLAEGLGRGVHIGPHTQGGLGRLVVKLYELRRRHEALMDGHIRIHGVFAVPGVWHGVTTDDDFQAGILQGKTDRTVAGMNRRPGPDGDTVFLIDLLLNTSTAKINAFLGSDWLTI